jgi:hypothetical protein
MKAKKKRMDLYNAARLQDLFEVFEHSAPVTRISPTQDVSDVYEIECTVPVLRKRFALADVPNAKVKAASVCGEQPTAGVDPCKMLDAGILLAHIEEPGWSFAAHVEDSSKRLVQEILDVGSDQSTNTGRHCLVHLAQAHAII